MSLSIQEHVPLAPLTTFKIGGPARYFADVSSEEDIREAIQWAGEKGLPVIVLAGGSNVLVPDRGVDALVIRVLGDEHSFEEHTLSAHPGCNLLTLIKIAGERGSGGWEKLAGIPGTIGGAVRGNAGAFGPEIKDFVERVRALNIKTSEVRDFNNEECSFEYRESFFKNDPEWIITQIFLKLLPVVPDESKKIAEETIREREKRHIQNVCAAGSYFKNPIAPYDVVDMFEREKGLTSRGGRVPAGWLIEKAGMKGAAVGDAQSSSQHPNYIVNNGRATAEQVRTLAEKIRESVLIQFKIRLEEEAVIF